MGYMSGNGLEALTDISGLSGLSDMSDMSDNRAETLSHMYRGTMIGGAICTVTWKCRGGRRGVIDYCNSRAKTVVDASQYQ